MSTGRVTVFGATGTGGRAYVRAFRDAGYEVRGVIRPGGNAGLVRRLGAEPVEVDLAHPDHAAAAVDGADAVVVSLLGRGVNAVAEEAAITRSAFEAARRAGVGRVVYTSVHLADARTGVPHFDIKAELERDLAATGLPWTVLRPTTFMEGLDAPFMRDAALESGVVVSAIDIDTPISYVATDDLARLAVIALEDPRLDGAVIPIGGPPVTYRSLLPLLSAICGRELPFRAAGRGVSRVGGAAPRRNVPVSQRPRLHRAAQPIGRGGWPGAHRRRDVSAPVRLGPRVGGCGLMCALNPSSRSPPSATRAAAARR